jgi:succinoglycan biosynthesis transport protein ExoP
MILMARAKVVAIIFSITFLAAFIVVIVMPKTYKATTALILNYKGADPLTGATALGQSASGYLPTYMSTQIDIIKSPTVALKVVDELKLAELPSFRKAYEDKTGSKGGKTDLGEWISSKLLQNLEVKPSRESSVINISYDSTDPRLAAMVANAFSDAYRKLNVELDVGPSRTASVYFNEQLQTARNTLESALKKMSQFQEENGIVNSDNRADVETMRLNELSSQLVTAQSQLMEASSRRNQVQDGKSNESPDVTNNPLIQNLKTDLSKAEVKLNALSKKFTAQHPYSEAAKAESDSIRSELQFQILVASKAISNNANILGRRESELRAAVSEQKAKVLELNRKRSELSMFAKEVESAQRTYDAVSQRLAQTRIQGQSNQSDISVLTVAAVPKQAAMPSITITLLVAAFIGLFLGAGTALIRELYDRRIRSEYDLEQITGLPVLATLEAIGTDVSDMTERIMIAKSQQRFLPRG